ncbi:hypothetical protein ACROYT_G016020 [Oculina patagonica]
MGVYFVGFSTQLFKYHEVQQPLPAKQDFADYKELLRDTERTARRNLIIVSHGRSGSTLTGDIFNHHPSVFYMYEPLQTAKRVQNKLKINDTGYSSLAKKFLTDVFRCKFDHPDILDDIENPPDMDCKIIFLVRDPRAMIASSRDVGFFKEKGHPNAHWGTRLYSYQQCKQTEDNLEFVRKLPDSLRDRIKLLRYEDLAIKPLNALEDIFGFAGLPVPESVRTWLNETTQQSRKACDKELDGPLVTCTKDDAWAAANRWRWKVHPHEIDIIEHYCRRVMNLMGYKPVDISYDLLSDSTIPLFSDDYEAKHWFLH